MALTISWLAGALDSDDKLDSVLSYIRSNRAAPVVTLVSFLHDELNTSMQTALIPTGPVRPSTIAPSPFLSSTSPAQSQQSLDSGTPSSSSFQVKKKRAPLLNTVPEEGPQTSIGFGGSCFAPAIGGGDMRQELLLQRQTLQTTPVRVAIPSVRVVSPSTTINSATTDRGLTFSDTNSKCAHRSLRLSNLLVRLVEEKILSVQDFVGILVRLSSLMWMKVSSENVMLLRSQCEREGILNDKLLGHPLLCCHSFAAMVSETSGVVRHLGHVVLGRWLLRCSHVLNDDSTATCSHFLCQFCPIPCRQRLSSWFKAYSAQFPNFHVFSTSSTRGSGAWSTPQVQLDGVVDRLRETAATRDEDEVVSGRDHRSSEEKVHATEREDVSDAFKNLVHSVKGTWKSIAGSRSKPSPPSSGTPSAGNPLWLEDEGLKVLRDALAVYCTVKPAHSAHAVSSGYRNSASAPRSSPNRTGSAQSTRSSSGVKSRGDGQPYIPYPLATAAVSATPPSYSARTGRVQRLWPLASENWPWYARFVVDEFLGAVMHGVREVQTQHIQQRRSRWALEQRTGTADPAAQTDASSEIEDEVRLSRQVDRLCELVARFFASAILSVTTAAPPTHTGTTVLMPLLSCLLERGILPKVRQLLTPAAQSSSSSSSSGRATSAVTPLTASTVAQSPAASAQPDAQARLLWRLNLSVANTVSSPAQMDFQEDSTLSQQTMQAEEFTARSLALRSLGLLLHMCTAPTMLRQLLSLPKSGALSLQMHLPALQELALEAHRQQRWSLCLPFLRSVFRPVADSSCTFDASAIDLLSAEHRLQLQQLLVSVVHRNVEKVMNTEDVNDGEQKIRSNRLAIVAWSQELLSLLTPDLRVDSSTAPATPVPTTRTAAGGQQLHVAVDDLDTVSSYVYTAEYGLALSHLWTTAASHLTAQSPSSTASSPFPMADAASTPVSAGKSPAVWTSIANGMTPVSTVAVHSVAVHSKQHHTPTAASRQERAVSISETVSVASSVASSTSPAKKKRSGSAVDDAKVKKGLKKSTSRASPASPLSSSAQMSATSTGSATRLLMRSPSTVLRSASLLPLSISRQLSHSGSHPAGASSASVLSPYRDVLSGTQSSGWMDVKQMLGEAFWERQRSLRVVRDFAVCNFHDAMVVQVRGVVETGVKEFSVSSEQLYLELRTLLLEELVSVEADVATQCEADSSLDSVALLQKWLQSRFQQALQSLAEQTSWGVVQRGKDLLQHFREQVVQQQLPSMFGLHPLPARVLKMAAYLTQQEIDLSRERFVQHLQEYAPRKVRESTAFLSTAFANRVLAIRTRERSSTVTAAAPAVESAVSSADSEHITEEAPGLPPPTLAETAQTIIDQLQALLSADIIFLRSDADAGTAVVALRAPDHISSSSTALSLSCQTGLLALETMTTALVHSQVHSSAQLVEALTAAHCSHDALRLCALRCVHAREHFLEALLLPFFDGWSECLAQRSADVDLSVKLSGCVRTALVTLLPPLLLLEHGLSLELMWTRLLRGRVVTRTALRRCLQVCMRDKICAYYEFCVGMRDARLRLKQQATALADILPHIQDV